MLFFKSSQTELAWKYGVSGLHTLIPNFSSIDYYSEHKYLEQRSVPQNEFGFHPAYAGLSYLGFVLFSWNGQVEHFTGCLNQPLQKDSLYKVSFHIKYAGDSVWIYSKTIGVLFTPKSKLLYWSTDYKGLFDHGKHLTESLKFNIEKTYTERNWLEFTGIYKANGGEKFITFGLFYQGDKFFKLCEKYNSYTINLKKKTKFIESHEEYPFYVNKHYKPSQKSLDYDYAYYFIDAVSVTPVNKESVEDFTF